MKHCKHLGKLELPVLSPVRAGGAGGRAIALNGFTATVTVTGTIYGAVS
jgi:hypothetical protein